MPVADFHDGCQRPQAVCVVVPERAGRHRSVGIVHLAQKLGGPLFGENLDSGMLLENEARATDVIQVLMRIDECDDGLR